jgi:TolB-like protein/tetratricopeptide (TPR) repeat protein
MSPPDISRSGAKSGPEGSPLPEKKLISWKEIAAHLGREVRTVQRWEKKEGLPVRRHEHQKKSTVYAYPSELDEWVKRRQPEDDPEADAAFIPEPDADVPAENGNGDTVPTNNGGKEARGSTSIDAHGPPEIAPPIGKRLAIALVAAAILVFVVYRAYHWHQVSALTPDNVRLVVLPFANLTGDPSQEYLSAGLTDVITTQLGHLDPQHIHVIAPTSAKVMAGKPINEIRQALNVQYILEGSVQRVANQIRVDIRLIQANDEVQAAADSFTRDLTDFLQVESEVSNTVAHVLMATLPAPAQLSPRPGVVTAEAASKSSEAFLKGVVLWTSREDLKKSIAYFEEAVRENPYNAQAYAGLANATAIIGQVPNDGMPPKVAEPKAREAARHALELDPRLVEAHAVLGNVAMSYDWDLAAAEKELKLAIKLNPNYGTAHEWYAHLLMVEGRFDEALAETGQVLELEPATPLFHVVRAEILYHARRYDESISEALNVVKAHPEFVLAYYWLGSAYREKKMYREAIATFEQARKMTADLPFMVMAVGHAQAVAGNTAEANNALNKLAQIKQSRFVPDIYPAAIYVGLGDKAQAFTFLDLALQQRIDRLVYLRVEPMADPLRSDPRFAQLLARIGTN